MEPIQIHLSDGYTLFISRERLLRGGGAVALCVKHKTRDGSLTPRGGLHVGENRVRDLVAALNLIQAEIDQGHATVGRRP